MADTPDFDLPGVPSFTARIGEADALANRYRARGIPVVFGGSHITLMPEESARRPRNYRRTAKAYVDPKLLEEFRGSSA